MIAARHNDGVDDIKRHLAAHMPGGPFLYPDDQLSDAPMRLIAAEITREKLFLGLDQELPYALFVETETWEENDRLINIAQAIYVQREGQKKIVLGEKGSKIKRIGIAARKDLEAMTGKKVNIRLFVKVRPHWKNDPESYRIIGLPQQ